MAQKHTNISPKAKAFHFKGYRYDAKKLTASFDYQIEFGNQKPLDFTEKIIFPKPPTNKLTPKELAKFLEPLHLVLGISYYKLYFPNKITTAFPLSKEQAVFWNTVYTKGLGEFMFRNKLDPKKIGKFPFKKIKTSAVAINVSDKILLGIGGGKDSIVAAELMREFSVTSFLLESQRPDPVSNNIIDMLGNPSLTVNRVLDPKIFQKYEASYNGHIPISAIIAFIGLITGAMYGYRYVAVGNGYTSNFGNVSYKGLEVNHQWSKSAEFESLLQDYTRKYISGDVIYFSALRQFMEIRVMEIFGRHKKYLHSFTSCNRNFKVNEKRTETLWCGECDKCHFVFLLLAAFLPKQEVVSIFGKNLLADANNIQIYKDLLGFGAMKPFDCVGTFEESQAALVLASKHFKDEVVVRTLLPMIKKPELFVADTMRTFAAPTLPTPFKFLGVENVAIIGYGAEGKVTERYLKAKYPHLKIGILDENLDKDYLLKQKDYDFAIKTPGIPKEKITIPYTTATNIFFSEIKNFTIGITGSKGKSTTTSLIYDMVKASGKPVRLLGNIGNPMLEVLLEKNLDPKEIFVVELSSYMLDDIQYSPNIALLLNLFPEHMNYHGSVEKYYAAKKNIFKFQKNSDVAVTSPFNAKIPVSKKDIPLMGAHNLKNIQAAIAVAKAVGVKDAAIKKAIKDFKPLPHRLERVGTYEGITFYDDANASTPQAAVMAIKSLKKIDTMFLGGTDRGYDFTELEKTLRSHKIRNVVLFPDSGKRILKSRKGFNVLETRSMREAVAFAFKNGRKGTICLLSTGSPSYSLWKNFGEKGAEFKKHVEAISKEKRSSEGK